MINLEMANTFIKKRKLEMNTANINAFVWMSIFFCFMSFTFLITTKLYTHIGIIVVLLLLAVTLSMFLFREKVRSFKNNFLILALNFLAMTVFLNFGIYGFQKIMNTYNAWFFGTMIIFQIIVLFLISVFR